MKRAWCSMLCFVFLAAAPRKGAAGNEGDAEVAPAVDDLIVIALSRAPRIMALEARSRASREREAPAGTLPDPMIGLSAQAMGLTPPGPASAIVVDVSQELPYPGKRAARRATAEAETTVRTAEIDDLKRRIAADVRILYARIYSLDQERAKRISTRELLDLLSRTVASRYSTGESDLAALLRIQLEGARIDERLIELDAEREELVASLNGLLDQPGETPLGRIAGLPKIGPLREEALGKSALKTSSELAVLRAGSAAAQRRVDEAQREQKPDFSVGLGGGIDGMAEPVVMVRFGVTLPIWHRNKSAPLTRAAEQELVAARYETHAMETDVRSRISSLLAAWRRDEALIKLYTDTIIPQSRAVFEAAQVAYLANRGDFAALIEDYGMLLESEIAVARRESARFETWALLTSLTAPPESSSIQEAP